MYNFDVYLGGNCLLIRMIILLYVMKILLKLGDWNKYIYFICEYNINFWKGKEKNWGGGGVVYF